MQNIYILFCNLYSIIFSFLERVLFKKKNVNKKLFYKLDQIHLNKISYENFQIIKKNEYLEKIIFPKHNLIELIDNLFVSNKLKQKITEMTGYEYSISFFTAYKIYKLKNEDIGKNLYANIFHTDKPYTENMLKIIFTFNSITEQNGPMELILENKSIYKACLDLSEIFIFFPNLIKHRATSPQIGERFQMMLQLNPANKWQINNEIFNKQKFREPKFPFFSYFFDKKNIF